MIKNISPTPPEVPEFVVCGAERHVSVAVRVAPPVGHPHVIAEVCQEVG